MPRSSILLTAALAALAFAVPSVATAAGAQSPAKHHVTRGCQPGKAVRAVGVSGGVLCTPKLQRRLKSQCTDAGAIASIAPDGTVTCAATGTGTVRSVDSGAGLSGGPITDKGTLSLDPNYRLPQGCAGGQVPKANSSGGWLCGADQSSSGTVTSVGSGTGLTGGPVTSSGTLSLDPNYRLPQGCGNTEFAESDGSASWLCAAAVTSVDTGLGLTGGPITTTGTIAADPTVLQKRVTGTCSGTTALQGVDQAGTVSCSPSLQQRVTGTCSGTTAAQGVNSNGTVSCSSSLLPVSRAPTTGAININTGNSTTLFDADGVVVTGTCSNTPADFTISIGPSSPTTQITYAGQSHSNAYTSSSPVSPTTMSSGNDDLVVFNAYANNGSGGGTLDGQIQAFTAGSVCAFEGHAIAS